MPDGKSWSEMSLEEKVEHLYEKTQDVISMRAATEFSDNIVRIVDTLERDLIELRRQPDSAVKARREAERVSPHC